MVRASIRSRLVPALVALAALAGCQDDEIRHYRVPRAQPPSARLLAAVLPVGGKFWFVSVTGPAPAVGNLLPDFEAFVKSLRFPENERRRVTWDLPADWHREPNRDRMRYATFRAGPNALEVRVYTFGPESGNLLANVNRWRGQVGLDAVTEAELPSVTRPISVDGIAGTFVDMTGPGANPDAPMTPPLAVPAAPATGETLAYDTPPGWQPVPASGMRLAAFKVTAGDKSAEITIIPLAGAAGGLLANVNRWRDQVGLPATTDADLRKEAKMLDSPAGAVVYVDITGPKGRTLGGTLLHGGRSWFVKMTGPAELVGAQQPAFEAFVKSLRFEAGTNK
ncbi:MAG TPA: hypothetical protein VH120_14310 [Gemmataceae bacterium]|jgi:hypothetical protein|nr:hypothetical protein [Gemmataceae bacterium]